MNLSRRALTIAATMSLLVAGLLPTSARAADIVQFDLSTNVTLEGSGVDLIILAGSDADEVIVDLTTLTVTVDTGDSFTLRSPDLVELVNDGGYDGCDSSGSFIQVTVVGPDTVIFTPAGACPDPGGDDGDGGGGGGGTVSNEPVITVTEPDTGDVLVAGDTTEINWSMTGSGFTEVKIEYSSNGGSTYSLVADDLDDDDLTYLWTVPSVSTDQAVVKISGKDSGGGTLDTDTTGEFSIALTEEEAEEVIDEEQAAADAEAGITTDAEGRRVAPGSGVNGLSPFDGTTQEISEVADGWFIRGFGSATVYLVDGDERHPFWDGMSYFTYADSWNEIVWVTDATLPTLDIGTPQLPNPGVVLVKITTDDRVYLVEEGAEGAFVLRWVTSESIASQMFGSNWADYVIDIDSAVFPYYAAGADVTFAEDVDLSAMKTRVELAGLVNG